MGVPEVDMTGEALSKDAMTALFAWCLNYTFQSGRDHDDDENRVLTFFAQTVFLNHSCDPNAQMSDPSKSVTVKALRDIGTGEEITICYNPRLPHVSLSERQELLKHAWGFSCR